MVHVCGDQSVLALLHVVGQGLVFGDKACLRRSNSSLLGYQLGEVGQFSLDIFVSEGKELGGEGIKGK